MGTIHEDLVARAWPGVVDWGENAVTFGIYAPQKRSVRLLADFNHWNRNADPLTDRGDGFWVAMRDLPPGPVEYQFLIDDQLVICDPYAQAIRRMQPGQPPHAIFEVGRPIYQWQYEAWQRPDLRDLIIYELHVGDFTPEGTFQAATAKLDYLHSLGINAIEFMPLYEPDEDDYWGYQPAYLFSVRQSYGSMQDLLTLVDQAHSRGIAVLLDIVLAHTGNQCPLHAMYPYEQSPWYGQSLGEQNQFGLPMLDFRKDPTNAFVRDVQDYWLRVYHFDGFRYDYLAGIGADLQGKGLPLLMSTARQVRPEAYLIGEMIPENPPLVNDSGISAVFHTRIKLAMEALFIERKAGDYDIADFENTVRTIDPATQDYNSPTFMANYVENHDEHRLARQLRDAHFDDEAVLRKTASAIALLMTVPGEPMLYQGQEWAADNPKQTRAQNKLDWNPQNQPLGRTLHDLTRSLCLLRRSRGSLRAGEFRFLAIDAGRRSMAFFRKQGQADQVVVAMSFSSQPQQLRVEFPQGGRWHQFGTGKIIDVTEPVNVQLPPYWFDIYIVGVS